MTEDEKMWGRFYNKEEEESRIWAGIRKEEREEARAEAMAEAEKTISKAKSAIRKEALEEGLTEGLAKAYNDVVINMYKQKMDIEQISSYVNISKEKVENIIQNYSNHNN